MAGASNPQQARNRKQVVLPYSANNKVQLDLGRGMQYRELALLLKCQPTVTGANNTAANTVMGDEWACVKKIEVIANGNDVIKSISGRMLRWLNTVWRHATPGLTATLGDGATANPSCSSVLMLPMWSFDTIRPLDTVLASEQLSNLQIAVTWGDHTSINATATGFTTNPTLTVDSLESFGLEGSAFSNYRFYEISQPIVATNADLTLALPVGPVYRGFTMAFDDAGTESGAILNNFKLTSGTTVFADMHAAVLNDQGLARLEIARWMNGAQVTPARSSKTKFDGFYHYDHVSDGYLSEGIDTLGFSELIMHLDVTIGGGTTTGIIIPHQIIPVRG